MEEKYILSDRGKVYYWIKESNSVFAKNLIFLPGLTANHHLFDFQIQYFSKSIGMGRSCSWKIKTLLRFLIF